MSPVVDPECGGYYFNEEAIRTPCRIEYLHTDCGINLIGIKKILRLMNEMERLQAKVRFSSSVIRALLFLLRSIHNGRQVQHGRAPNEPSR